MSHIDEVSTLLDQHLNKIIRVAEVPMRCALTREWFDASDDEELCQALSHMLRGALRGQTAHRTAMFAVCVTLIQAQHARDYALFERLFAPAHKLGKEALCFLYRDSPPERTLPEGSRLPEARLPLDREISLGERRSLAARSNRDYLEHLLHDPNPMVLAKLLKNPALSQKDILLVASRRPTLPALLETILDEGRWLQHHDVREALARNPYIQTGYALKILPTLHVDVLRQLCDASTVHRGVRDFARLLVRLHDW